MTHSECPQQCTAFGGSARRKRSGSTIGSYCRISSARLRVLCSPIVRKTLLEVAKWRHLDLPSACRARSGTIAMWFGDVEMPRELVTRKRRASWSSS